MVNIADGPCSAWLHLSKIWNVGMEVVNRQAFVQVLDPINGSRFHWGKWTYISLKTEEWWRC